MELPGGYPVRPSPSPLVPARVAGVVEVDPVLPLPAQEGDVPGVDDDDVVAALVERVVDRLALALQAGRDDLGRVEGVLPAGVVEQPLAGEGAPLGHALEAGHGDEVRMMCVSL